MLINAILSATISPLIYHCSSPAMRLSSTEEVERESRGGEEKSEEERRRRGEERKGGEKIWRRREEGEIQAFSN